MARIARWRGHGLSALPHICQNRTALNCRNDCHPIRTDARDEKKRDRDIRRAAWGVILLVARLCSVCHKVDTVASALVDFAPDEMTLGRKMRGSSPRAPN